MTIIQKTLMPSNIGAAHRAEKATFSQWEEARAVFSIYLALAKQTGVEIPFGPEKRALPARPTNQLYEQVCTWLDQLDHEVLVHQLRHLLQMTTLNASEEGLRALIQRHLRKSVKSSPDRDKIDFLLVQYFALCAPAKIYHKQIELADVALVMKPVLGDVNPAPLPVCAPLEKAIETLRGFRSLRDILKTNFIEQGRRVKEAAGGMFYDPSALFSFIRFNFLMRRTLIELMHADLIVIRNGLRQLQGAGVTTIDCRQSGLTAAETVKKIKEAADEWKQPFQKEYTERTVNQAFEKLLGLRSDVEHALERAGVSPREPLGKRAESKTGHWGDGAQPAAQAGAARPSVREEAAAPQTGKPAQAAAVALDFESCLEKIWEQLIATPPSRGRSMMTVNIGPARILMSSWEVAAFISENGPSAEDLRRAVVARALVTAAVEQAKETGNATTLERALNVGRVEVSRLQERVDIAKQAKDTEAAVNMGISTKRLISTIDEAEKL